jgi:hypothetical protein
MTDESKSKKTKSLEDQIKENIAKTGFPLEMYALNVCSQYQHAGRMPSVRLRVRE